MEPPQLAREGADVLRVVLVRIGTVRRETGLLIEAREELDDLLAKKMGN
jgi:hypothetical protein